jgi:hypothetical protein
MTKDEKRKRYCSGCYCNDYNHGLGGAKECWSLADAKVVWKKLVHIDQHPPWNQKPERMLDCFHMQRYVCVGPKRTY